MLTSDPDVARRIEAEAEFQNRRTRASEAGEHEPRDRFYFLAARAMARYHAAIAGEPGQRVLVVGSAEGTVTSLARHGARVTGIDISDTAISSLNDAISREGLSDRASARVMNGEALDFPEDSFDLICCSGVLHHLDVAKAAASWARVLSSNGRVAMIEPMAYHPLVALYRLATPSMRTADEHPLGPGDLRVLRRHFGRVEAEGFALTSLLSFPVSFVSDALREVFCRSLERVDGVLIRGFPPLVYMCWTAVIQLHNPR